MIYVLILTYFLIGTIVSAAMKVNEEPSVIPLFFWPLVLLLLLIFGMLNLAFQIGEKIAEKLGD